jgi:hypothetical protein
MYYKNWRASSTRKQDVEAVERGDYWLVTLTSENYLAEAFTGYTVEVMGRVYEYPLAAFPPLFGCAAIYPEANGLYVTFETCRIRNEELTGEIRAHWHQGWDRIITLHQNIWSGPSEINIKMIETMQRLFKYQDSRGAMSRFNFADVTTNIQRLQAIWKYDEITADQLAAHMNRSAKGVQKWLEIEGHTMEELCASARAFTKVMQEMEAFKREN